MKITKEILIFIFLCFISANAFAQFDDEDFNEEEEDTIVIPKLPEITKKVGGNMNKIDSIIAFSKTLISVPYRYGGTSPRGFDCSGLIQYVFNEFGIDLPRRATNQYKSHIDIPFNKIKKGDLVFFQGRRRRPNVIGHVGLVVSDSIENGMFRFIHASSSGVRISKSTESYYLPRYLSACRVIEEVRDTSFSATQASQADSIDYKYHSVKKGESLFSIAKKYGITTDSLRSMNNLQNNNIKINDRLIVKKIVVAIEEKQMQEIRKQKTNKIKISSSKNNENVKKHSDINPNNTRKADKREVYVVKKGDTLYKIAKKYNTNVQKIKDDNNLTSNNLKINQEIVIIK